MYDVFLPLGLGAFYCADKDKRSDEPEIIAGLLRGFVVAIIAPADRSTRPRRWTCAPAGALSSRSNTLNTSLRHLSDRVVRDRLKAPSVVTLRGRLSPATRRRPSVACKACPIPEGSGLWA
jgi:hypothetical protein